MHFIVLGAGLVGGPMALDLADDPHHRVTVADVSRAALARLTARQPRLETAEVDLSDADRVSSLVRDADLVLSAVPGPMGFATLRAVIEAGRDVVDIAFFEEDPFALDESARERGVTAVVDCGVAPGMSNMLCARAAEELDQVDSALILVGGLPVERRWPYEYRAVFSPIDVLAEYTRPARLVEHGRVVVRDALSEVELVEFEGLGTLEAFNSDGLRTLATTLDAPSMKEKTLRYPGHAERMRMLRESGFFGQQPLDVGGTRVRPIDVTAALLFEQWRLGEGEADLTAMRVEVTGRGGGRPQRHVWTLLDRPDPADGVHSMARTTGYTATAVARLVASGGYRDPGIRPPEFIGRDAGRVRTVLAELADRGVVYRHAVESGPDVVSP